MDLFGQPRSHTVPMSSFAPISENRSSRKDARCSNLLPYFDHENARLYSERGLAVSPQIRTHHAVEDGRTASEGSKRAKGQ